MSHTVHGAKGQHKQAAIADHERHERKTAEHHDQIAVAAYFHAQHRGFKDGDPVADWLAAENEINATIGRH